MGECHLTVRGMAEVLLERAGIDTATEERLDRYGYFKQPASIGYHLAEYGGLVKHSINVTQRLVTLTRTRGGEAPRMGRAEMPSPAHRGETWRNPLQGQIRRREAMA